MCGRFVRSNSIPEIAKEFGADEPDLSLDPSYNVAPSQDILIVVNDGRKRLVKCRWGFIPHWAKDEKMAYKMINARTETVADKPSYRAAFKKHRCLVVASGFYEWKREGKVKSPYYILPRSGKPIGFAGLFSIWHPQDGTDFCTSTIITTGSNDLLSPIHDRMPVIIREEDRDIWLDPSNSDSDKLLNLLRPYDSNDLVAYEISRAVNSPSNDSPDNILPVKAVEG
ncbi:MAG: SOS response-associated peptidase [Nitrospirota bacterium]|nr:MAG: SOS response-associated peptidase [Nitrospirota bacterium]